MVVMAAGGHVGLVVDAVRWCVVWWLKLGGGDVMDGVGWWWWRWRP